MDGSMDGLISQFGNVFVECHSNFENGIAYSILKRFVCHELRNFRIASVGHVKLI